jgi:hypothetical protein
MKTNHKICSPTKKCVFDIETIGWTEPYACGFYDGKEFHLFEDKNCIKDFLNFFLCKKYRSYFAFAHNGGKFDFSFILRELCTSPEFKGKYEIQPMRVGSRIIQIKIIDKHKHMWTLRDSVALLPFSLRDLTTKFNVENKKGELEYSKITWDTWKDFKEEWLPYLISDCKGLYQVLTIDEAWTIKNFNVSYNRSITIAQQAMQIYRQNFLEIPIPNYESREDDMRKSYYGGRTEIFKKYGKDLHYYDVNSLYPAVMKKYPMPVGVPIKDFCMSIYDFGVAYCDVECPEGLNIPLLPYKQKTKQGHKLIFPSGKFSGWYCTPELQKAHELGYKIKIHYGYKFQQQKLFTNYIDTLYKIKQNAKSGSVDYIKSKLLMNSLYGKFGQRREKEQVVMFPESTIGLEPMDFFGELPFYLEKKISKSKHILPAIASFVTSYARVELYKILETCDPLYCDTDSCVTAKELPTSTELGDIKDEIPDGIAEAVFLLPKMYAIKTNTNEIIVKCKGFPKNTFGFEIFKDAFVNNNFDKFTFTKEKFALPFESMRRNKSFISLITATRKVVSKYDKRVYIDNINTNPIVLAE